MKTISLVSEQPTGLTPEEIRSALISSLEEIRHDLKKVLLVVPDITRNQSGSGLIANQLYHELEPDVHVDVLPAIGTHVPMSKEEATAMYGDIPFERFIVHNWRTEVVKLGEVPVEYVKELSEGALDNPIPIQVNRHLMDESYDLILSIGQVVPHEVVGMANYTKNVVVGAGGEGMINYSHYLGAVYGMERLLGRDHSPVRKLYDYAEENMLGDLPLVYILTVTTAGATDVNIHGVFIGEDRAGFEAAVKLSQEKNIIHMPEPLDKVVVWLDPEEFHSTWVGNKAVYRTRMAIADGGELIILAEGVNMFGEDSEIDVLLQKYGYTGRDHIIELTNENKELQDNLSAAAHLIHGSSDGRFTITYCTKHLTEEQIRSVGYEYLPYEDAADRYLPESMEDGHYTLENGESYYFIKNPALGNWQYDGA